MKIDRKGTGFMFLHDEDLELVGVDPTTISVYQFKQIVKCLMDHYNEGFTDVLADIVRQVKGDY